MRGPMRSKTTSSRSFISTILKTTMLSERGSAHVELVMQKRLHRFLRIRVSTLLGMRRKSNWNDKHYCIIRNKGGGYRQKEWWKSTRSKHLNAVSFIFYSNLFDILLFKVERKIWNYKIKWEMNSSNITSISSKRSNKDCSWKYTPFLKCCEKYINMSE